MTQAARRNAPGRAGAATRAAVLGFVVMAAVGVLVVLLRPVTYRSLALVSLDQPSLITSTEDAGGVAKLSHLREIYGPLLTTSSLTQPISEETGLTEEEVADRVQALVPKDSLLLGVAGTGPTPAAAQKLAAAAADEIVRYAADLQQSAGVAQRDQVVLSVVSPARPGVRATRATRTLVTVAGFLGLLGAAIAAALRTGRMSPPDRAP